MKFEEGSTADGYLGHEPIFNSDFPVEATSLFEKINWRADLDNGSQGKLDFDSLLNNTTALGENGIWNESIRNLINYYKANFKNDNDTKISGSTENSSDNYTPYDIKHANAGRNFSDGSPWVRPWENNVGQDYDTVRDSDKIEQVLRSSKNLQFTREARNTVGTILNYYIRLIMPKYTRRVEVEDLNRNFWVIGQSISAIAAYLFDDSSPIKTVVKNSLSEILQLWENVMYLWAAVELLNEKKGEAPEPEPEEITAVHREVIDYPRAADKPFRDISSFVDVPDFEAMERAYEQAPNSTDPWWWRLKGYKELYADSHLCLLIRCRLGNYEKDYYHTEVYPYAVIYNRNKNEWYYIKLKDYNGKQLGITLRIDSDKYTNPKGDTPYNYINIGDYVFGLVEKQPTYYQTCYPFSKFPPHKDYKRPPNYTTKVTPPTETNGTGLIYHAMVRIAPSITGVTYTSNSSGGAISFKIKFEVTDIARKLNFLTREDTTHIRDAAKDNYMDKNYPYYNDTTDPNHEHPLYDWTDNDYQAEFYLNNGNPINYNSTSASMNNNPFANWPIKKQFSLNSEGVFFTTNQRDSGYQLGMRDMLTYIGISQGLDQYQAPLKVNTNGTVTLAYNTNHFTRTGGMLNLKTTQS